MTVRPYLPKDMSAVESLCVIGSGLRMRSEIKRRTLLKTYCDYYLEEEPSNCFVAVDENDKPIGCILCAENFEKYIPRFREKYYPVISKGGKGAETTAKTLIYCIGRFANYYPAHFQVNVLPAFRGEGVGTALVAALKEHMTSKGVRGMAGACSSRNKKAQEFLAKQGFETVESGRMGIIMGLEIGGLI